MEWRRYFQCERVPSRLNVIVYEIFMIWMALSIVEYAPILLDVVLAPLRGFSACVDQMCGAYRQNGTTSKQIDHIYWVPHAQTLYNCHYTPPQCVGTASSIASRMKCTGKPMWPFLRFSPFILLTKTNIIINELNHNWTAMENGYRNWIRFYFIYHFVFACLPHVCRRCLLILFHLMHLLHRDIMGKSHEIGKSQWLVKWKMNHLRCCEASTHRQASAAHRKWRRRKSLRRIIGAYWRQFRDALPRSRSGRSWRRQN